MQEDTTKSTEVKQDNEQCGCQNPQCSEEQKECCNQNTACDQNCEAQSEPAQTEQAPQEPSVEELLAAAKEENAKLQDLYMRALAEAENARRLLEAELQKHGLTFDDIREENKRTRMFKYNSNEERTLLIQVLVNYLGSKSDAFSKSTYNKYKKQVYIDLTDMEYIDISNMYDFFKAQFRKERKRLLQDMIKAFVQKHRIFDSTPQECQDDDREIDWEEMQRIFALSSTMEDVAFRKQLTK